MGFPGRSLCLELVPFPRRAAILDFGGLMADWFKFYNDGLDSKGMQFAMSEQPLVTSVWLVIMSEASKNRSAKIKWDDADFEIVGFARKINISVPIFNQSVVLLERIKYISRKDGNIIIHGWDNLQSDYARGLDKGYYKKTSKKLASDSLVSTARREESREEETRKEKEVGNVALLPRFQKPSIEEIRLQAAKCGMSEIEVNKFFNYYESNGWRVGRNPMRSWTHALTNWKNNLSTYGNQNGSKPNPRNNGCAGDHAEIARKTAEFVARQQPKQSYEQPV